MLLNRAVLASQLNRLVAVDEFEFAKVLSRGGLVGQAMGLAALGGSSLFFRLLSIQRIKFDLFEGTISASQNRSKDAGGIQFPDS